MPTTDVLYFDVIFFCRAVGLLGFAIYVLGFFLLCSGRLTSATPAFFLLNLTAASCVLVSLVVDFNLSSALIQGFYLLMSLGAVVLRLRMWRSNGVLRLPRHYMIQS